MLNQEKVHIKLIETKKTLALAESCSGGYLATKFTALPDASKYFLASFVLYVDQMKEKVLHVSKETLRKEGAVSRNTADEMWLGLMKVTSADFGIAITGIAGPSGGTIEKPVGLVFIAIGTKGKKPHIIECRFKGDRKTIIEATCEKALQELFYFL